MCFVLKKFCSNLFTQTLLPRRRQLPAVTIATAEAVVAIATTIGKNKTTATCIRELANYGELSLPLPLSLLNTMRSRTTRTKCTSISARKWPPGGSTGRWSNRKRPKGSRITSWSMRTMFWKEIALVDWQLLW